MQHPRIKSANVGADNRTPTDGYTCDKSQSADFEFDISQIKNLDNIGEPFSQKNFYLNLQKLTTFDDTLTIRPVLVQKLNQQKTGFFNNWWKREQDTAAVKIQNFVRHWHQHNKHSHSTLGIDKKRKKDTSSTSSKIPFAENTMSSHVEEDATVIPGSLTVELDPSSVDSFLLSLRDSASISVAGDTENDSSPPTDQSINSDDHLKAKYLNGVNASLPTLRSITQSKGFKRMKIAQELVATEQNYVQQLINICEIQDSLFQGKRLQDAHGGDDHAPSVPKMSHHQCRLIFGNATELLNFNKVFLSDLVKTMKGLYPDIFSNGNKVGSTSPAEDSKRKGKKGTADTKRQLKELHDLTTFASAPKQPRASKMFASSIGKVFLDFAAFFKSYAFYSANYAGAQLMLDSLIKGHTAIHTFLQYEAEHQEGGMILQNLLIAPVQRIPRYALLLEELLKNTPTSDDDVIKQQQYDNLSKALEMVRRTATYINDTIRRGQALSKVVEVQQKFRQGICDDLVKPNRYLLKQGALSKMSQHGYLIPREYFLFSDVLLQAERQSGRKQVSYNNPEFCWVLAVEDDRTLRSSEIRADRSKNEKPVGLLQRLKQQLLHRGKNNKSREKSVHLDHSNDEPAASLGRNEMEKDPGTEALATAETLFTEGKLSEIEYNLIKDRVVEAEETRINDDSLPCSFKVVTGEKNGDFIWLCAQNIELKEEWVKQLRASIPKHRQQWERHVQQLHAKAGNQPPDICDVAKVKLQNGLISQEEHDHIVAIPAPPDIDDNHSQSKSLDISRTNHTDSDKQITSNENQSQISFENSKVVDSGQSHELPNSSKSRLSTDIIESQCVEYGSQGYLAVRNALAEVVGRPLQIREKMSLRKSLRNLVPIESDNTFSDHVNESVISSSKKAEELENDEFHKHLHTGEYGNGSIRDLLQTKYHDGVISREELNQMLKVPFIPMGRAQRSVSSDIVKTEQNISEKSRAGESGRSSSAGACTSWTTERQSEPEPESVLVPETEVHSAVLNAGISAQAGRSDTAVTAALSQSTTNHDDTKLKTSKNQRKIQHSIANMTQVLIKEQTMQGYISEYESNHIAKVLERARLDGMVMASELPLIMLQQIANDQDGGSV